MGPAIEDLRDEIIAMLPRLRRFARSLAREPHDADDLVQITVERALGRAAQFHGDSHFAGWLFGILRNAWIDECRSRRRREPLHAPEELADGVGDPAAGSQSELLCVQDALFRLPEEQRLAVSLVLIEGFSYKEAAEIMNVPIGTLTSRLARGREALQNMLSQTSEAQP
ncbi:MAG TPA: sigma-70 family RNA polymerase sigma factor [Steroidobacteraceae bacterium]|nr:sigma-70 family RNA polymerase sigma factor [Steroidobacteraceae bacterium]